MSDAVTKGIAVANNVGSEESVRALEHLFVRSITLWISLALAAVLLVLGAVISSCGLALIAKGLTATAVVIGVTGAFGVFYFRVNQRQYGRPGEVMFTFTDSGFRTERNGVINSVEWRLIRRITETRKYIFLRGQLSIWVLYKEQMEADKLKTLRTLFAVVRSENRAMAHGERNGV